MAIAVVGPDTSRAWFTRDFGAVQITGVAADAFVNVRVEYLTVSGAALGIEEQRCTPVGGSIQLLSLARQAEPYFTLPDIPSTLWTGMVQWLGAAPIQLKVSVFEPSSQTASATKTWTIRYSRVRTDINLGTDRGFLGRHGDRTVTSSQLSMLHFVSGGDETVEAGIVYRTSGGGTATATATLFPSSPGSNSSSYAGQVVTLPVGACRMASLAGTGVAATDIVSFSIRMTVDDATVDFARFRVRRPTGHELLLVYRDCFGNVDSVSLTGQLEKNTEMAGSYMTTGGEYLKTYTELTENWRVGTGYVRSEDREAVLDMAESDLVYLYTSSARDDRVTITALDDAVSLPKRSPWALAVTLRKSSETQRSFRRGHLTEQNLRIFDHTFDSTFE